jgi:hypothetical protein
MIPVLAFLRTRLLIRFQLHFRHDKTDCSAVSSICGYRARRSIGEAGACSRAIDVQLDTCLDHGALERSMTSGIEQAVGRHHPFT